MAKASRAWTWLKKHPAAVLLVVALAAAVAYVAYRSARRTEGWEFLGTESDIDPKHASFVESKCREGWSWDKIKDGREYLKKYDEAALKAHCDRGRKDRDFQTERNNTAQNKADTSKSDKTNSSTCKLWCEDDYLKGIRPCRNNTGDKCCKRVKDPDRPGKWKLTNCAYTGDVSQEERDRKKTRKKGVAAPSGPTVSQEGRAQTLARSSGLGYVNVVEYNANPFGAGRSMNAEYGDTLAKVSIDALDTCYKTGTQNNSAVGSANIPEGHMLLMFRSDDCSGDPSDTFSGTGKIAQLRKHVASMKLQRA